MDPAAVRLAPLLDRLVNHERRRFAEVAWSLDAVHALLDRPGAPGARGRAVQIVGSKGKGTTALYLEAAARGAGVRTGTYTSPHLETLLERIRIDGAPCAVEDLELVLAGLLDHAAGRGIAPSYFEVLTAAARELFAGAGTGLAVYEAGLGARWDATTAVPVDAAIVTAIEREHEAVLGETVAAIAGEKAHAIRPGRPAFTTHEGREGLEVLRARAREVGAELFVLGRDFAVEGGGPDPDGALRGCVRTVGGGRVPFRLAGAAPHELPACAAAVACLVHLLPDRVPGEVARPVLPGRFERLVPAVGPPVVLDGAHTPGSMAALAGAWRRAFGSARATVLFATAGDKRWREGLSALLPVVDRVLVTALEDLPSEDPHAIAAWLRGRGVSGGTVDGPAAGLRELRDAGGPGLVTGSFYLVGAVRSLWGERA